jgi:hypothetical protein
MMGMAYGKNFEETLSQEQVTAMRNAFFGGVITGAHMVQTGTKEEIIDLLVETATFVHNL